MLAVPQGAHTHVRQGREQGTSQGDQHRQRWQGCRTLQEPCGLGHQHHPRPAQRDGEQHPLADPLPQHQPGQQGRDRGIEVLQHRGGGHGQLGQGCVDAEQGGGADGTPQDQEPPALAPGIHACPLQQPPAQGHAHDRPGQHHFCGGDSPPHLLHAQPHQAEGQGAGHHLQQGGHGWPGVTAHASRCSCIWVGKGISIWAAARAISSAWLSRWIAFLNSAKLVWPACNRNTMS